jgi:hypothetical protein
VTRDPSRGGLWRALAPILGVAFAVRLAWVLAAPVDPREAFLWDMTFYDLAALQVADGVLLRDFDGVATARWTPGYPILLGGTYAIFGTGLLVGKLLNVVLATFTVAATGLLGARLFGREPGLLAAALLALLPGRCSPRPCSSSCISTRAVRSGSGLAGSASVCCWASRSWCAAPHFSSWPYPRW